MLERKPQFNLIQTIKPDYASVTITQYESARTGMRIAVVDQKGPKVEGYFALATEIHDNTGAPHTLEHLIFMGSKSYRYKGLLDRLSSRAFSTTNAWTGTDQTVYELKTAGWEAFAQMLPVYLEHLIVPTITDAACYTEVHHIDGTGNDAGVVYSEMQGRENTPYDLMELQLKTLVYPDGIGFRSETGGMTKELRSLTADRIRAYHQEMYQPKNMRVILIGEIDHEELLQILDVFEDTIIEDVPKLEAPFQRPWVESPQAPMLSETTIDTIQFPEEDESVGEISVAYMGPDCNDSLSNAAMSVLLSYLAGGSISVLDYTLQEKEQLCSGVYYQSETRPSVLTSFQLTSVETDQLKRVYERFVELLKETASKPLDMNYMQDCLERVVRRIREKAESSDDFFSEPLIDDHLYGDRNGKDLQEDLQDLSEFQNLAKWSDQQWREFLSKWFADNHHVCVLGVPSKELSDKLAADEKARVQAQKDRLGEAGLRELAEKLEEAQAENNKPIPDALIERFPVPSPESVRFITTTTARAGAARRMGQLDNEIQKIVDDADDGTPLFLHFEHIPSNFVRIKLHMCTASVPTELKPLISLYLENLFTAPINRDGKRVEFEDVVSEFEKETTWYYAGSASGNSELVAIQLMTEPQNYESIISRLRAVLFDAIRDPERLQANLARILADVPSEKRSGESMVMSVLNMIQFERPGTHHARNTLSKALYLKRLKRMLKDDPDSVTGKLEAFCNALHRPENFRIYVATDMTKLSNPVSAWQRLTAGLDTSKALEPLDDARALLSEAGRNPGSAAYIVPITAIDSSHLVLSGSAPDSLTHSDLPALLVAIHYLQAVEGPLWVAVRGTGLAYGASFIRQTALGKINFEIHRSPDAYKAYAAAQTIIQAYASGAKPLDRFAIQSAIGELVYGMAEDTSTMGAAAAESFVNQVIRGVSKEYSAQLLAKVGTVEPHQIAKAMETYIVPLFRPQSANLVVTCAALMEEGLVRNFKEMGFRVESRPLDFFQDDYGLPALDGDDEGDDDEEDEEDDDDDDDDEDEDDE